MEDIFLKTRGFFMIKNVVFDIGMVLITFDWDKYVHKLFNDEVTEKAVTDATWRNPDWNELDKGVLSTEEVCRLFEKAGKGYEEQVRLAFYRMGECPGQQPYAIPWIKELKAQGLNVYYLSNYSYHLMDLCPEALSFREYMDGGVFSCEEKLTKPDVKIYEKLCKKYGLIPSECLFTDDLAANIEGAKKAGFNGVQFESYEKNYDEIMKMIKKL